jgi:hypothetical protein
MKTQNSSPKFTNFTKFLIRAAAICVIACLSCSCWVRIENKVEGDEITDQRLVGVWKIVHQAPDEIKDPDALRYDEDAGIYGPLVIGKSAEGNLIAVGIDRFRNDGVTMLGDFIIKTRKHKDKQFIVGDFVSREEAGDEPRSFHFVMEYAFNEDGDLFLWGMHDGLFDKDYFDVPPLHHRVEKTKLGGDSTTITAPPAELLDFLSDPRVSPHLLNCGKYRKMILPEGNSSSFEE